MNQNDENAAKEKAALVFHIINLQARIDALTAAVQVLAAGHGSDGDTFHAGLKKCTDAFVQKRLEILEGQSPAEAALIDLRKEAPDIDQSFLDGLKSDDKS
jgi:hypothetical protein